MIPDKYIELMNREVDGVNSRSESRTLKEYLSSESEARRYYHELCDAVGLFEKVTPLDPPPHLRQRILDLSVDQTAQSFSTASTSGSENGFWQSLRDAFSFRSQPSHAYAFVAGLLAGVVLLGLVWQAGPSGQMDGIDSVYGTILAAEKAGRATTSGSIPIDLPGIEGHTRAIYVEDHILVQLSLTSQEQVQVKVRYDERAECESFRSSSPGSCDLTITGRELELSHSGVGDYDILLQYAERIQPPIEMQIITDGTVLSELSIEPRLE
jgi:hypothetical protein